MKYKNWIIGGIVAVVAIILYFVFRKKQEPATAEPEKTPGDSPMITNFPIKFGSTGEYVKDLQRALNKLIKTPDAALAVDGIFGEKTLAMLKKYGKGRTQLTEKEYRFLKTGGLL